MLHTFTEALIHYGIWGILLLAFIDSAGIPVSMGMDVLVILLAANDPQRGWLGAGMGVVGSLVGNLVLFMAARHGGRRFIRTTAVPTAGRAGRFREWFTRYGMLTVFFPATLPIPLPLKVFVVTAGLLHTPVAKFVGVIAAARVLRYFGEAWLGMEFGRAAADGLGQYKWLLLGVALAFGLLSYLVLRLMHRPELSE